MISRPSSSSVSARFTKSIWCTALALSCTAGLASGATACSAQDWANAMFASRNHDFGSVARAAKTEHEFEFVNNSDRPVHVSSVRASCGCTTPVIVDELVAPGATGRIRAEFNTRSFLGQRGATITVVFDQPRYGEAQLRVDGYVRRDVVCDPGEMDFGAVKIGAPVEAEIDIQYAGRSDWAILNANSNIPGLDIKVTESSRANGRVAYRLAATYSPVSTGFINGEIQLETNDGNHKRVPIVVTGNVVESVSVSPSPLVLGSVSPGLSVTKKVIVKADRPFKIVSANCADPRVSVELPEEAKPLQMLPITFLANDVVGSVEFEVVLESDDAEIGTITVKVQAEVLAPTP